VVGDEDRDGEVVNWLGLRNLLNARDDAEEEARSGLLLAVEVWGEQL